VTTRELLREECLKAFQNYVEQAGKTCGLLGDLEDKSVPLNRLLALLAQTQAEDQAQKAYVLLRQQLFEVLEPSQAVDIEPARRH
jgi:hypothetical protein